MLFYVRQCMKMLLQSVFLPAVYRVFSLKKVNPKLVIFADGHHREMPYNMKAMYQTVKRENVEIQCFFCDFQKDSFKTVFRTILRFMKAYATAGTVFICDYYLPAASCRKRKETQVVQLWHACGIFKKFGYDTTEDIPAYYKNNPFQNTTLVTVSAPACEQVYADAMHLEAGKVVIGTGVSKTDVYFNRHYQEKCKKKFYRLYPETKGKKIVVWAPSFRGNAANPTVEGLETVEKLKEKLGSDYAVIIKLHPHVEKILHKSNCTMATEDLFSVADIFITDYSTLMYDFMLTDKPIILFTPDKKEYLEQRGFYLDYDSIPAIHVENGETLAEVVRYADTEVYDRTAFCRKYIGKCDGQAIERILDEIHFPRRNKEGIK